MADPQNSQSFINEVAILYKKAYPGLAIPNDFLKAYTLCVSIFQGTHPDFQPVDTPYHDFSHTLETTLCLAKLLTNYIQFAPPPTSISIPNESYTQALIAALFHDTGYIKLKSEVSRHTGAIFLETHELRSAALTHKYLPLIQIPLPWIEIIEKLILSTKPTDFHRMCAYAVSIHDSVILLLIRALKTADYLAQLGSPHYLEKLPLLYQEFQEAASTQNLTTTTLYFNSIDEFYAQTILFWNTIYSAVLKDDCHSLFKYLNNPYPDGTNSYIDIIRNNIQTLQKRLQNKKTY